MLHGACAVRALPFAVDPADLLLGMRKNGEAVDLVVNIGSRTNYSQAVPGHTFAVTNFSRAQLDAAFPDIGGARFSITGCVRDGDPNPDSIPIQTLWVTRPRASLGTEARAWNRSSENALGPAASRIRAIGLNAENYSRSQLAGPNNTATVTLVPSASALAYGVQAGNGNLSGSFQGNIEVAVPAGFSDQSSPLRADLFEVRPGSGPGTHLGFFEFRGDGTLWFTAAGGSPAVPQLDVADARALEGDDGTTNLVFQVAMSIPSTETVGVLFSTADGSAIAGEDYLAQAGLLTFSPGQTNLSVSVPIRGDRVVEPDETVLLQLSHATNASLGRAQAQGLIVNDDIAAPTPPRILALSRVDGTNRLAFLAPVGARCSVLFTNAAGLTAPLNQWAAWPEKLVGASDAVVLLDPAAAPERFYSVVLNP
jgi:hypothetical protein